MENNQDKQPEMKADRESRPNANGLQVRSPIDPDCKSGPTIPTIIKSCVLFRE